MEEEVELVVGNIVLGHGTLTVSTYVAHKSYVESKGMEDFSHYDFCMQVVLEKICPAKYG